MSFAFLMAGGGGMAAIPLFEKMNKKKFDIKFHGGEFDGDVFIVETEAEAGYLLESHVHEHSHRSVLVSGQAEVTIDGVSSVMTGPKIVNIPANTQHKVQAITDIVWLCIWAGDVAPMEQAKESLRLVKA